MMTTIKNDKQAYATLSLLKECDHLYFNRSKPKLSDKEYDKLKDELEAYAKTTRNKDLRNELQHYAAGTGVLPDGVGKKIDLPLSVPSLDKIKSDDDDDSLVKWINKICKLTKWDLEFIVSPKLDGSSLTLEYDAKTLAFKRAFTRGDGAVGRDVSEHAKLLIRFGVLPDKLVDKGSELAKFAKLGVKNFYIRCELMVNEKVFERKWKGKEVGGSVLKESRNAVNGFLNATRTISEAFAKDLTAFAYTLASKEMPTGVVAKRTQLKILRQSRFSTYERLPGYMNFPRDEIRNASLNEALKLASTGDFTCDGIVVEVNDVPSRHALYNDGGRPLYGRAYKLSHNAEEGQDRKQTAVTSIEWNPSKDGKQVPLVHYQPVTFGATKNTKATGIHAKNIKDLGLGTGAQIGVVRSGGVIPRIVKVYEKSKQALPTKCQCGAPLKYKAPNLYCTKPLKCDAIKQQVLSNALVKLGVPGMAKGRVDQLYSAGYTTLTKLRKAKVADLAKLDKWGDKLASTVVKEVKAAIKRAELSDLMVASGVFIVPGFALGSTRLEEIEEALGAKTILNPKAGEKSLSKKLDAAGIKGSTAECFLLNIETFRNYHARLLK